MKRKLITLLMAISLSGNIFFTQAPINVYAANNSSSAVETVQNVGDELYGFKFVDSKYNNNSQSTQMLFEHEKTGAKILVIKNSDLNRGFSVSFNTPAENDKGINHILEHSLLAGSDKYPSGNMIFNVMNNTYTSFINAFTMQNTTMFPVCSQSEEQLMKLTDIYMDAVYHPLVAKDKRIFEREAWRYELDSADSPLAVNGIVYNEMKGNYSDMDTVHSCNVQRTIFKDTNQQYNSGGVPSSILDLSYEEFLETYKRNYTPSNSFMVLYGDVDYAEFLKMIDENYLSSYSRKDIAVDKKEQPAFAELVEKDYDFPVSKDYDTTNKSKIDVVFSMPALKNTSFDDYAGMTLGTALLADDSSDFMKALRKSNIAENYDIGMSLYTYQPTITISAINADPSKKHEFYDLVMNEIKKEVNSGINKEMAKSKLASLEFSKALENEEGAVSQLEKATIMNIAFGDPMLDTVSCFDGMEGKLDDRYIEGLIDKYIIQNTQKALVTTNPKAGLLEENNEKLKKSLEEKKASMSADEINALVDSTKAFKEWNSTETDQSIIDSLKAVNAKDIPVEVKDYNVKDSTVSGVREITGDAQVSGIGKVKLIFDESHLTSEELLYLKFYSALLMNRISSKNYSNDQIQNTLESKSCGQSAYISAVQDNKDGTEAHPAFCYSYIAMDDGYKDIFDLSSDMLLNSNLDDNYDEYVKNAINDEKQQYEEICARPNGLIGRRALAYDNLYCRYQSYFNGIEYHDFIADLEKEYNENPQKVMNKIKEVRDKAFGQKNLTVLFSGSNDSKNIFNNELGSFVNKFSDKSYDKVSQDLPVPSKREAFTSNIDVQYMYVNSDLNNLNISNEGKLYVLSKLLNEKLLIPQLRLNGGAYGGGTGISYNNYVAYSYRDNDFVNSLKVINSTDEYMKDSISGITDKALDSYIISTYAQMNSPCGELTGSMEAAYDYINNITLEDKKNILNEIKATTVDSLKDSEEILRKLNDNSNYVVAGSPQVINEHKDLFDKIIPLQ